MSMVADVLVSMVAVGAMVSMLALEWWHLW